MTVKKVYTKLKLRFEVPRLFEAKFVKSSFKYRCVS
jgi:hypothetical protein